MIRDGALHVSGDRVLAIFAEMPRSGIGIGYGLDLPTGHIVYTTAPAPHGEVAAAPRGGFFIGRQGYGVFKTKLVDRDGDVVLEWPSAGHAIVGDTVRIVELESVGPSRSHVATLLSEGGVARGVRLPSYYTSSVLVAGDGGLVFWRDGAVVHVSADSSRLVRLFETPRDDRAYVRVLVGEVPGRVAFLWGTNREVDGELVREQRLLVLEITA